MGKVDLISPKLIEEIYILHRLNYKQKDIIERTGYKNVYNLLKSLNKHIQNYHEGRFVRENYLSAIESLKKQSMLPSFETAPAGMVPEATPHAAVPSRYEKLDSAFKSFTEAITEFIEEEVDGRVEDVKNRLEEQKQLNKELASAIEEARHSNWITNLRKRLSNT